jgi:hypothetical protein
VANSTDCDDTDASVHPNATETCNSIDDDCDGSTDEGVLNTYYHDSDGDGYGDAGDSTQACSAPPDHVANSTDCDDTDASVHPNATETCNGIDDDCDNSTDEGVLNTYYHDADGDGYGDAGDPTQACSAPSDHVTDSTDCNDNDADINPGVEEICNDGIDNNCDGIECTDPACYDLPDPLLAYAGSELLDNGNRRHYLEVDNSEDYPDELFAPAPHLPPCGSNTNSSRTWVEIYDDAGPYIYGFCALTSSEGLNSLWFSTSSNEIPPEYVSIEIDDRECGEIVDSNSVAVLDRHYITQIDLSPNTPAELYQNEYVDITFNYHTTEYGGVRIFVRPFTNGALTLNYAAHPSNIYPSGGGSGSGYFTITSGSPTVDQLRFRMYNADQSELLLEFFMDVSYSFYPEEG